MRINAKLIKSGDGLLVLEPFGYSPKLEIGKPYSFDVKEYKSSRSIEQNSFMWAIIQKIALVTGNDTEDIYVTGLERSGAKPEWIAALPETEDALKRKFRAVKPMGTMTTPKGVELVTFKCFVGSSQYDVKEMTALVDYFIRLAAENGIYIEENG